MSGLITDLLDLARIDTGTLSVAPEETDAAMLVDQARNTFLSGGGRKNVTIDLEPDIPPVLADHRRIVQVLLNLLSNAENHSPKNLPILVAVAREGIHVTFSVVDHGKGLSSELLPTLFRKFSRIDGDDQSRGLAGTGMGLAICKGDSGGPRWGHMGRE